MLRAVVLRRRGQPRTYQLGARIAAGGMGEVYEAHDGQRRVAVKRMLDATADDEDLKLLFLREVAVAATLEHHNVVEVLDAGQAGSELYLVMEYVDGPSLAEIMEVLRIDNKIVPVEIACGIVSQVANGLAHAHERALPDGTPLGIVHRDVAPENVLIGTDGVPKLVDFGLAKLSGHSLTEPGIVRGRPRSLSPEQARGDHVDLRSDIFSLGAMLFELLSGDPLYPNEQVATLLWKVAAGDYEPLRPRLAHVDDDLIEVVETALAVEPRDRFRSMREVERALDGFRAAREMRVSSRALAEVVAMTWPTIQLFRRERLEGTAGEIEGTTLTLPPDKGEKDASSESLPVEEPAKKEPKRSPVILGDRTSKRPPRASELPRPTAPARRQKPPSAREAGWLLYAGGVLAAAGLAFAAVWSAGAPASPEVPVEATVDPEVEEGVARQAPGEALAPAARGHQ